MSCSARLLLLAFALCGTHAFAQYEDLSGAGGPASPQAPRCVLNGVKVTRAAGEKGGKEVSIAFLFSGKPSVFFNYYDAQRKAVVFDFYDTHPGKVRLDTLREAPITGGTVDSLQIDLNKEAKGMEADIRDVVRVSLLTPYNLDYEVKEGTGSITLNYKWSDRKEAALKREKNALYWQIPVGVVAAGGVGFAAYELLLKKESGAAPDVLGPTPPAHPQ